MSGDNDSERKKRRLAVFFISSLMLVAMVVAVGVGVRTERRKMAAEHGENAPSGGNEHGGGSGKDLSASHKAVKSICHPTDYRRICKRSLSFANSTDPKDLIQTAFQAAMKNIEEVKKNSSAIKVAMDDKRTAGAMETCNEVMDYALGDLRRANEQMGEFDPKRVDDYVENMRIWLSGAINFQETCIDAFENTTGTVGVQMKQSLNDSQELTSNGLAMATKLVGYLRSQNISGWGDINRLLSEQQGEGKEHDKYEHLKDIREQQLMKLAGSQVKADVVVAKDGSGKYKTIMEALKEAPRVDPNNFKAIAPNKMFVVYIKEGIYEELVRVERNMTHVMFIGDGPTKTIITGKRSFSDGFVAYKTATVSIMGSNFIAKDIGFENTAGPEEGQAVALMVQSDMSIFYNCHINGYRETLNAHTYRQFYRDCTISGTMDFIFGDAAAVFQNCQLVVRKPLVVQDCSVVAQSRTDHKEATAIVLHNCTIGADPLALPKCRAYLGRPAKKFSKVVILQSFMDDSIAPAGWMPWMGNYGQDTCTFVEYLNRGPGAVEVGRVRWPGIKHVRPRQAIEFTPSKFMAGNEWIAPTQVPYKPLLIHV